MTHKISETKVYKTTNSALFNRVTGNREVNMKKVRKIMSEIMHGNNMLPYFPILTTQGKNGKLDILDGQHRFQAAKMTKNPVFYIIQQKELKLDDIAKMNSIQDKWKAADFIRCYIERGIKDYSKLEQFMDDTGLSVQLSLNLLYYGTPGRDGGAKEELVNMFQQGRFEVRHMRAAKELYELCKMFESFPGWKSRSFMLAIHKLLVDDLCDFDELAEKFNAKPEELQQSANFKTYLVNLEQIYNRGYHKRRNIYN